MQTSTVLLLGEPEDDNESLTMQINILRTAAKYNSVVIGLGIPVTEQSHLDEIVAGILTGTKNISKRLDEMESRREIGPRDDVNYRFPYLAILCEISNLAKSDLVMALALNKDISSPLAYEYGIAEQILYHLQKHPSNIILIPIWRDHLLRGDMRTLVHSKLLRNKIKAEVYNIILHCKRTQEKYQGINAIIEKKIHIQSGSLSEKRWYEYKTPKFLRRYMQRCLSSHIPDQTLYFTKDNKLWQGK